MRTGLERVIAIAVVGLVASFGIAQAQSKPIKIGQIIAIPAKRPNRANITSRVPNWLSTRSTLPAGSKVASSRSFSKTTKQPTRGPWRPSRNCWKTLRSSW